MASRVTRSRQRLSTPVARAAEPTKSAIAKEKPNVSRKRAAPLEKIEEPSDNALGVTAAKKSSKRARTSKANPEYKDAAKIAAKIKADVTPSPKGKQKANTYNLIPGTSPYPSYARPTPQECQNVAELLAAIHGKVEAPKTIPAPNIESSGCGEVPSVLDALVRTRLSAATNGANSSRAFRGLVDRFGLINEGVGKGSVDWDKVRQAPVKDVFEAIKTGGLADVKSRDIQKILNMVYEENQANNDRKKSSKEKTVLSLDHLHSMNSEEAFDKLIGYPGIGPKTASCVLLFCMQRPSFAVDTHVFRIVSWLGWVPSESAARRIGKEAKVNGKKPPPPVTRNTAYAHLDLRIPDELKYPLHYLFIRHGKSCPSCAAKKDSKIREAWGDKKCPLAALKKGRDLSTAIKECKEEEVDVKEEDLSESTSA